MRLIFYLFIINTTFGQEKAFESWDNKGKNKLERIERIEEYMNKSLSSIKAIEKKNQLLEEEVKRLSGELKELKTLLSNLSIKVIK